MKTTMITRTFVAMISLVPLMFTDMAIADPSSDGAPLRSATSRAIAGQFARYRVTDMSSIASGGVFTATVIQVNNLSTVACNVGAEYYPGFSNTPACTTTFAALSAGQQATLCSRNPGQPESCNSTCSPELTFTTGYAIVYSSCFRIGVQATIYTEDSTGGAITSARDVNLVFIGSTLPANNANRGD